MRLVGGLTVEPLALVVQSVELLEGKVERWKAVGASMVGAEPTVEGDEYGSEIDWSAVGWVVHFAVEGFESGLESELGSGLVVGSWGLRRKIGPEK